MRVRVVVINGLVLGAIGWMAAFGTLEARATRLLPDDPQKSAAQIASLESTAALSPSAASVASLASAYLDRGQPGLATAAIEGASPAIRARPEVAAVHARALLHGGHAREALAVAHVAQDACTDGCAPWLVAKTARQVAFLEQVVAAGIEDPAENPSATKAAYDRSAHEVRLVAMR